MVHVGAPAALGRGSSAAGASALAPDLGRYRLADLRLSPPAPGRPRVVFMGDSITALWHLGRSFPGRGYLDRGISGQTSGQILDRFTQDVLDLSPRAVVLLAGSNDLRLDLPTAQTEADLARMVELAQGRGIAVVLGTLPPLEHFPAFDLVGPRQAPAAEAARLEREVGALDTWIRAYAAAHHVGLVDYYRVLAGPDRGWGPGLSVDGVHPSRAGYARMASLVQRAVAAALAAPPAGPAGRPLLTRPAEPPSPPVSGHGAVRMVVGAGPPSARAGHNAAPR